MQTITALPRRSEVPTTPPTLRRAPPAQVRRTEPRKDAAGLEITEPLVLPDLRLIRKFWQDDRVRCETFRPADMLVGLVVLLTAVLVTNLDSMPHGFEQFLLNRFTPRNLLLLGSFVLLWRVVFGLFGLYDPRHLRDSREEAWRVLGACTVLSTATLPLLSLQTGGAFRTSTAALLWLLAPGGTLAIRHLLRLPLTASRSATERRVLVVGSGPRAHRLYHDLTDDRRSGIEVVGFVDTNDQILHPEIRARWLGTLDDLEGILMRNVVDEVVIALPVRSCYERIQSTIRLCEREGIESNYLANVFESRLSKPQHCETGGCAPLVRHRVAAEDGRLVIKRAFDIVAASVGMMVLVPLFVVVALAIKLTSPGPVFFAQKRYGHHKRLFSMYKFRTMVSDAETLQFAVEALNEAGGPIFKIKNDPRVTRIGALLRRTSIDELPQLFNVLRGEMSLVGPRPMSTRDVRRFEESWLMRRFSVRPGITGLWQVSGRSELTFDDWIALDLQYIDNWSLWLDLRILIQTIPAVLRGSGAM
jgi:exopolysaccharide biosynthesis polyprenyl glycosylphosphotransferase